MRRILLLTLALGMMLVMGQFAPAQWSADYELGEVIVGLQARAFRTASQVLATALRAYGGEVVDSIPELSAVKVEVSSGSEQAFMNSARALGEVSYTELNYMAEMYHEPNDKEWPKQWGPKKIDSPKAWDLEKGDNRILLAVVDSGTDHHHLDINEQYIRRGRDHVDKDTDPYPSGVGEGVSHGTHVTGIAVATMDNRKYIAGLAQVSTMAERVLDATGSGSYWNVAAGIVHAASNQANIINLSLGGPQGSELLESSVKYAWNAGALIVAAAGNSGKRGVGFPAAYDEVIAVSATDKNDKLASFSSYGPEVELAAPGVEIVSTIPGNSTQEFSGTSMASPHVAGVAALVWSADPELTNDQIREFLRKTAVDLGKSGKDEKFGYGRVNAHEAVKKAQRAGTTPPTTPAGELSVEVDNGCAPRGTSYQVGEQVTVSYNVPQDATVNLYRIGYLETEELIFSGSTRAGVRQTTPGVRASRPGVETIVIQARTSSGTVLTDACTYSIGGVSPSSSRIWIDKGCGSTYSNGESITISLSVNEDSSIKIIDFMTDGQVADIVEQRVAGGQTITIPARVAGPSGRETLVLRADTNSGTVVTSACSFTIR